MRGVDSNAEEMLWSWSCKASAVVCATNNFARTVEDVSEDFIVVREVF